MEAVSWSLPPQMPTVRVRPAKPPSLPSLSPPSPAGGFSVLPQPVSMRPRAMTSASTSARSLVVFFMMILLFFVATKTFLAKMILYKNVFVCNALF